MIKLVFYYILLLTASAYLFNNAPNNGIQRSRRAVLMHSLMAVRRPGDVERWTALRSQAHI